MTRCIGQPANTAGERRLRAKSLNYFREEDVFMDNRVKELILGYDLCNDYVQISCYNQKTQDMDTICYIGEKMLDRIPTVLCRLLFGRFLGCRLRCMGSGQ